jgi:hypothetical protein
MPNILPPRTGYDRSRHQLGRSMLKNPLRDFLRDLAKRDRVEIFLDFMDWGEAANFTVAQTQTSVSFTVVDGLGGVMAGTAVGTTTASISAIYKTQVQGNNNPEVEIRWKINTVASTYIVEAGFVNVAPATGASVVADIDTPSFFTTVTNAAIFGVWANQTHANFAFASNGSFTGQTVASTLLTSGTTAPAADTYVTTKVLLLTDKDETSKTKAYCWLNGRLVASHDTDADGHINGASAVYPWFYVQAVAATARIATVDYVRIAHDRAALEAALE